jgi:hypothetical protein
MNNFLDRSQRVIVRQVFWLSRPAAAFPFQSVGTVAQRAAGFHQKDGRDYSGGSATDFHRLPLKPRSADLT